MPRATSGWYLVIPLMIAGSGLGLLVSQLNNYTLSPVSEERVSEAAGVNSPRARSGSRSASRSPVRSCSRSLSFMFTHMAEASSGAPTGQQQHVANVLEHDAEVMSNTQLEQQLAGEPQAIQAEVLSINTDARHHRAADRPADPALRGPTRALQRVPDDAAPDPKSSSGVEGAVLG